jgi:hypothetical protein
MTRYNGIPKIFFLGNERTEILSTEIIEATTEEEKKNPYKI